MTVVDVAAPPADVAAPPDERPPLPPEQPDAPAAQISAVVICVAAMLSTAAAAVALTGVFTGIGAKLLGVAIAMVGPALVLLSGRLSRPAVVQYLVLPVAVGLGAVSALAAGGTGSATLPTLVADAVRGGGLGQPPVPFAPGWRFLLVTLLVLLGAGACSLAVSLGRPRLAVAAPVPVVVGAALVQPPGSAVATCSVALVLLVAALTVAAGADRDATDGAGRRSFELLRMARGVAGLAALAAVLVVLAGTGALLPKPRAEQVVPPRPPKPAPPVSDRVLFTVHTTTAADAGPWTTGVLDSYVGGQWLLPSYDRGRLRRVRGGAALPGAATGPATRQVRFTIGDLAGRNVPSLDGARTVDAGALHLAFDPQTGQLLSDGQQAPPGTTYAVDATALPTATQLEHAAPPPSSMSGYLAAPAPPAEVARVLAADVSANRFDRLQAARTYLYQHVVAAGRGVPRPVPPQRVAEMFAGGHASPFEITAAEALLARWVGVPARIGFGYAGGVAGRDGHTFTVHPANGAMWLQTWWPDFGWVSIVGRPAHAVTPTSLDTHQQAPNVRSNGQLALVVHVPVELASLHALFEDVRFYALVTLPWLALLVVLVVFHPIAWKALRRRRRRRWAVRRGAAARLLVSYADLRDRLRDLDGRAANATPLEFCSAVAPDDEHWELAWLVTRALWGDLTRDLRDEDVDAAEEMARSVRQRVLRAQRVTARLAGVASRASLRDPWTPDVPNAWPRRPRLRLPRVPALGRRPAPVAATAVLLVAAVLLSGCSAAHATVAARLPAAFVPQAVGPYALRESATAEQAFERAGSASLVTGGRVWTVVAPDGTVKGSVQAAVFRPSLRSHLRDVERGVRDSIGAGDFTLTRVGSHSVYQSHQSQELLLLYFAPTGGYYELLDARNDFTDAPRLFAGLLDYQQGAQARPAPAVLDPRRGGDD